MDRKIDRRSLLKGSVALMGGAAVSLSPGLRSLADDSGERQPAQAELRTWYALDPEWGAGLPGCPINPEGAHLSTHSCHACNSCHSHADNKLFATPQAADQNRAHVGCKCLVIEGGQLPESTWEELFGDPDNLTNQHVDRRWDWVIEVLQEEPDPDIDFAHAAFRRVWERTDLPVMNGVVSRSWLWSDGMPFTPGMTEAYEEGPDGFRLVQYYDKSRMEITDPDADQNSIWYVTNGLLVVELITGEMQVGHNAFESREPAIVNVAGDPDDEDGPTYATFGGVLDTAALPLGSVIDQGITRDGTVSTLQQYADQGVTVGHIDDVTGHSIATPFWDFMNSSGPIYEGGQFVDGLLFAEPLFGTGRPIAEPFWALVRVAGNQQLVLIQCFERRVLTFTPGNDPNWQVEAGNVGRHYYAWRYPDED